MNDTDANGIMGLENGQPFKVPATQYGYEPKMSNPTNSNSSKSAAQAAKESQGSGC